mmetsp:Transcript_80461/g.213570  ORF Transcript_80461/g.213570 Transcript_80461/m.213570 type:complete len:225 (-) Transcript_80461:13-687(-)
MPTTMSRKSSVKASSMGPANHHTYVADPASSFTLFGRLARPRGFAESEQAAADSSSLSSSASCSTGTFRPPDLKKHSNVSLDIESPTKTKCAGPRQPTPTLCGALIASPLSTPISRRCPKYSDLSPWKVCKSPSTSMGKVTDRFLQASLLQASGWPSAPRLQKRKAPAPLQMQNSSARRTPCTGPRRAIAGCGFSFRKEMWLQLRIETCQRLRRPLDGAKRLRR